MFASFGFPESRPVIIGILVVFELIFTPYNMVREREGGREGGREREGGGERVRESVVLYDIL